MLASGGPAYDLLSYSFSVAAPSSVAEAGAGRVRYLDRVLNLIGRRLSLIYADKNFFFLNLKNLRSLARRIFVAGQCPKKEFPILSNCIYDKEAWYGQR